MFSDFWFTPIHGGTITPVEIIWVTLAIMGLIYSTVNFHRSMKNMAYLDIVQENGLLRLAAKNLSIQQGLSTLAFVLFLVMGLIAIAYNPGETGGKIISWMLICAMGILAVKTVATKRAAESILNYKDEKGG